MQIELLGVLSFSNLLVWVPGLLFLIAVLYSLKADERGEDSTRLHQVMLGLFILSMLIAVLVPRSEIKKTLAFANAFDSQSEYSSFEDLSDAWAVKDAYFRTSTQDDGIETLMAQRQEQTSGGDLFDFQGEGSAADEQAPAGEASAVELTAYNPERGIAWFILTVFIITGIIFFVQGPKVLGNGKTTPRAL